MLRAGYAVEYDFVQPTELDPSLETVVLLDYFTVANSTERRL